MTLRRSGHLPTLVLVAALVFLHVPEGAALETAPPLPVLGVDPLVQGNVLEHHTDILAHWVRQNIVGAVLLQIDTNDALGSLEPEKLEALKALRDRGDTAALRQAGRAGKSSLFREGNFIRAAAGLGIVRELVWVMPFAIPDQGDAGELLKSLVTREGFLAADVESFRVVDGCFRGRVGDLPVTICGRERLPVLDAPMLLSIGSDYVPVAAARRGIAPLAEVQALFAALREARYAVRDAVVAIPVASGRMPVNLRWVGDCIVELLNKPALALGEQPPERWSALQRLYLLRLKGRQGEGEMLDVALSLLQNRPHDPALLLFAAEAAVTHGGAGAAQNYAEQACRVDPGYCVALREIGLQFMKRGNYEVGERFFTAEERLQPGMEYAEFRKGISLLWARRPAAALKVFEAVGNRDGAFPSGFMIGALQAASGDRAAARRSFDTAFAITEQNPNLAVVDLEVAEAIQKAVVFYREEGLAHPADVLETDPRFQFHPPERVP